MKLFKFAFCLLTSLVLASCNVSSDPTTAPSVDPSVEPSTEPSVEPSTEPTITGPIEYVDLDTAIKATENNYQLLAEGIGRNSFLEAYNKDIYINAMQRMGFIQLDSDPGYAHQLEVNLTTEDDYIIQYIDVYGRVGSSSVVKYYKDYTFFSVLNPHLDTFVDEGEGRHVSHSTSIGYDMKNFFQNNAIKYCNEFVLQLGAYGNVARFECYENGTIIYSFVFELAHEKKDIELYQRWVDDGSKVIERLVDYKFLYQTNPIYEPISVYEGEEITFEGIVSSTDTDGNLYVGNFDPNYGYICIKVEGKATGYEEYDCVKVTGTVKTDNQTAYLERATIVDLGKKGDFLPVYDEESLVDLNGGGTYAVNLFLSNPPVFASSVYSTYAYIQNFDEQTSSDDAEVLLAFDSYRDANNQVYAPTLVIPKNLSSDKKDEIYKVLKDTELYSSKNKVELSIQKVIIEFDPTSSYGLKFLVTEHSIISRKMSAQEKIEKNIGLENFPILKDVKTFAFTFGGFQGMILEDYYQITDYKEATKGLFISFEDISVLDATGYKTLLENYGYKVIEEVKDIYGRRQSIYQLNDTKSFLAIAVIPDDYEENQVSIEMWVYNRDTALLPKLIEDKLDAVVSDFFEIDEFTRKKGTYDADYLVFELDTYAGKVYNDKPLVALTVNSTESSATNYAKQLIQEKGYKQYKVNNIPYSYTTRGQAHLVLVSPTGTFVDLACYPTTDYTYYGHDEFIYRIEVLIYDAEQPISIKTYDSLDIIVDLYASIDPSLDYREGLSLPEGTVVEFWKDTGLKNIDYGFGSRDEVFIYSDDLASIWANLKESISNAGYSQSYNTDTRQLFSKYINGEGFYVGMLYEPQKGYIRLMHDVLGAAFY